MDEKPRPERRRRAIPPVVVLISLYVAGYFVLGDYHRDTIIATVAGAGFGSTAEYDQHYRTFQLPGIRMAYYPMGWLESQIRAERVTLQTVQPQRTPLR